MSSVQVNDIKCTTNCNIKQWLNKKYPEFIDKFTDENIKHAIFTLPKYIRDEKGNYTGTERSLLTPFQEKSDLEIIKNAILSIYYTHFSDIAD